MIPINKVIILETVKEARTFAGGLKLSDNNDDETRYLKARVIAASEQTVVEKGDIVYFDKNNGTDTIHKGKGITVIEERDIAWLDKDE